MPGLCLPEGLCSSSAVIRKFSGGKMELVSGCHVARAAQRDLDYLGGRKKKKKAFFLVYIFDAFCLIVLVG